MHKAENKAENNYSKCTGKSSENISSSIPGKRKDRMKLSLPPKLMVLCVSSPLEC
jgi:hypothetical protein